MTTTNLRPPSAATVTTRDDHSSGEPLGPTFTRQHGARAQRIGCHAHVRLAGPSSRSPTKQAFHFTFPSQRSIATVSPPPSLQRTEVRAGINTLPDASFG